MVNDGVIDDVTIFEAEVKKLRAKQKAHLKEREARRKAMLAETNLDFAIRLKTGRHSVPKKPAQTSRR